MVAPTPTGMSPTNTQMEGNIGSQCPPNPSYGLKHMSKHDDPKERRRLQNRIHQRAWRQRQKMNREQALMNGPQSGPGILIFRLEINPEMEIETKDRDERLPLLPEACSLYASPAKIARAASHYKGIYEEYSLMAPRPASLSALIRLNLLHAIARNSHFIGIRPGRLCREEFISPFNSEGPHRADNPLWTSCPMSLQPTRIQRRVVHHPWIDLLPFPQLRDNLLLGVEAGTIEDDDLSDDLMEFGSGDANLVHRPAMIVWGDSTDYSSWEVNAAFLKKWGQLLRGCPELIVATNTWRSKRGETALTFKT